MTSSPLLSMVAQSTVIFAPMRQVGWRSTSSTLAFSISSAVRSRRAPPEAVRMRWRTGLPSRARRHWKMAECSLSTGRSSRFSARARSMTRSPPATNASLLASSTRSQQESAAQTLLSPAMPTTAQSASSAPEICSARAELSFPNTHSQKRTSSGSALGSTSSAATRGRNSLTRSNSFSAEERAVRQTTRKRSG